MTELHLPWLEAAVLVSFLGACCVSRYRDTELGRWWCVLISAVTLALTLGAFVDFVLLDVSAAVDRWQFAARWLGRDIFVIDQLSAPLLPWAALLYFLTIVTTVRTKMRRFSLASKLLSESLVLATFCCRDPWTLIGLMTASTVPPMVDFFVRGKPTRVLALHMALFVSLMIVGQTLVDRAESGHRLHAVWGILPMFGAVLVRCGVAPFHGWMIDLFEHATLGAALLFVTPMTGVYLAVRLILPIAPDWVLLSIGLIAIITAIHAAGMALVQREARRFFCYLFLSQSALVLVGSELTTPIGLTGALCMWLSVGLALGGLGLTLRALEARRGRLSMVHFQGLYEHTPNLAMCFALTGLASVGFPGTFGFIGSELLVDGAVDMYPLFGIAMVLAGALNGIAVVQAYFKIFTGTRHSSSVSLRISIRERYAVLGLAALIFLGGIFPQPTIVSRHRAAEELLHKREALARRINADVRTVFLPVH
jgi:NADH-quinone oxidoreductase subunit M